MFFQIDIVSKCNGNRTKRRKIANIFLQTVNKQLVSTTIYFTYHSCIESCCTVGRLFTQGSYDELRKFVTNYIHTIVFEEKNEEKELMMSVRNRSPSRVEN